jgi:ABC-type branched-subunit amino acid transport system substrate-binding protein
MHSRIAIALCVLTAAVVAGCGGDDDDGPGRSELRLRVLDALPLSGDLATLGQSGRKSADLAIAQIRSATRRLGARHTVEIVHVDDANDPELAVPRVREQLGKGPAACLAGAWTTAPTIALLNGVTIPDGVLQISPAATADELGAVADKGLLARTVMPDATQGRALADVIEEDLGGANGRRVSVAFEDGDYGKELASNFATAWRDRGGIVVGPLAYERRAASYDDVAKRIAAPDLDAFAIFGFATAYQKLAPALVRAGGWQADRTYVADALAARALPQGAGAEATEGLRGTAPGAPEGSPATEAFDRLFTGQKGPTRQAFAAQLFDAVLLCYLSAVEAGRADGRSMAASVRELSGPPGVKYTWQQLPQAVRALEGGEDIDFEGASGPIDLNAVGDATAGAYDLFRFRNGRLEVFGQVPVAPVPGSG